MASFFSFKVNGLNLPVSLFLSDLWFYPSISLTLTFLSHLPVAVALGPLC